ncbi:MAG: TetR/AcrR family transcriptional regulator [Chloroflexi bacterium]|nr:TetR/AcrR family transcriptional regulator [Chloroflexota bacterium]
MSPRPDVSQERTRQILNAAMKVFARSGFQAASMDDIVTEAGLSKGALYWYFKSKDTIISGVLDYVFAGELAAVRRLERAEGTSEERLRRFARLTVGEAKSIMQFTPIAYEFYSLAFRNKTAQKALRKYFRQYVDALVPVIEQGVASSEFHPVDARQAAITIAALVEGTLLLWVFDSEILNVNSQLETGVQTLIDGLKTKGARKSKTA